jgi:hypothetical protein
MLFQRSNDKGITQAIKDLSNPLGIHFESGASASSAIRAWMHLENIPARALF